MWVVGRGWKSGQRKFLSVFCVGLLAGFFITSIGKSILLGETGLFDEYTLYHMKYMTVDGSALFCYIFRKRISLVAGLAVISTTYLGLAACMAAALWCGMSMGVFLAALAIRYGIKGIMLALVCMLPQYLLYVPAAWALLSWCEGMFRGIYIRTGGDFRIGDRGYLLRKAGWLAAIAFAVTVGCLLEGYVNPYLLLGFLKFF